MSAYPVYPVDSPVDDEDDAVVRVDDPWQGTNWDLGGSGTGDSVPESTTLDADDSPSTPTKSGNGKRCKIVERPPAPDEGRASAYVNDTWSQAPRGMEITLKNGIERGDITPIDVMFVAAGSEATQVAEAPGTDDNSPLGLIGRAAARAHNIQAAVKARSGLELGVADVNIVSNDDFDQLSFEPKNDKITESMKAAVNGEKAINLAPYIANRNGENVGFDYGRDNKKVLSVIPTGDLGGGKDLVAYESRNFKRTADNIKRGISIPNTQRKLNSGIVFPPLISTGGTSIDAHMALIRSTDISSTPRGTPQFVTVAPQGALSSDKAVAASRKKMASVVALTGIGGGLRDCPVILLDGSDSATRASIEADRLRTVCEHFTNLQPADGTDRSDILATLAQFSGVLGVDCEFSTIHSKRRDSEETFQQERELYLQSAFPMPMDDVIALSKGKADLEYVSTLVGENLAKALSQATGRTHVGPDPTREDEQRKSIKVVIVTTYLPDNVEISQSRLRDLQSAFDAAVDEWLPTPAPTLVVTYRLPAVALPMPIVAVRMMTHTNDVLDMLELDAPELHGKTVAHHSHRLDKPRHVLYENRVWRRGIKAVQKTNHPAMEHWAELLNIVSTHMYGGRGKKPRNGFVQGLDEDRNHQSA